MRIQTLLQALFKKGEVVPLSRKELVRVVMLPRKELVRLIPPSPPAVMKLYDLEIQKQRSVPAKCPCCQRPYPTKTE